MPKTEYIVMIEYSSLGLVMTQYGRQPEKLVLIEVVVVGYCKD